MDSKKVELWGSCKMSVFPKKVEYPFKVSVEKKNKMFKHTFWIHFPHQTFSNRLFEHHADSTTDSI